MTTDKSGTATDRHGDGGTAVNCDATENRETARDETRLEHHDITRQVIAAFYVVRRELGIGLPETVYANAMAVVLRRAGLEAKREAYVEMIFWGVVVGKGRIDVLVENKVIVEIKVLPKIDDRTRTQTIGYLRASKLHVGMILNFGSDSGFVRVVG
ncbi:MAG TPA: GxxExxY protein [Gemmatimonadaceae bacterium]|nr:GxxExxY protein [Gemmatimonadaceae bacterium]